MERTGVIFDKERARNSDPETSHQAAARVDEFAHSHRELIMTAIAHYGAMTVDEIAAKTGLKTQQVNKRLPELERHRKAQPTGATRKSASGRDARVWGVYRESVATN